MVELLECHLLVTSVDLKLEGALTLGSFIARSANDCEGVWVRDLLIELDLSAEHLGVRNTSLGNQSPLVELLSNLALVSHDHPSGEVLALEGTTCLILLRERDEAWARSVQSQLELRHLTKTLAGEASRASSLPLALNVSTVPALLDSQLTAQVDVLVVREEVSAAHVEDSIDSVVWLIVERLLGLFSPAIRVICPVTIPLTRDLSSSVRIPQLDKLCSEIVSDVKDGIGVTLDDSFFIDSSIAHLVLWATSAHQSLDLVKVPQLVGEDLQVVLVVLEGELLWEAIIDHVCQSHVHLTSFNVRVRTIEFSISFLEDGWPNLEAVFTATSKGWHVILSIWKPIIDNDVSKFTIFRELEHEASSLLPVIWIAGVLIVVILALLASK